jgi:hypothetical protein
MEAMCCSLYAGRPLPEPPAHYLGKIAAGPASLGRRHAREKQTLRTI